LSNRKDAHHELAKRTYEEIKAAGYRMVTSDYVLDEVITALFRNVAFDSAVQFVESLFTAIERNQIELERITEARFKTAWSLRKKYQDKPDISFTDLTSFVLMQELAINKVFTGNAHFEKVNLGFEIVPK
jgi:predicted nucleic acid-binding protein